MKLAALAAGVTGAQVRAGGESEIQRVVQDSRQAGPGDLFVAIPGERVDGHGFAAEVAARGAAVALEREVPLPAGTPMLLVPAGRRALGELAAELFGRPARRLRVAGVTGTDGKTTTTHLTHHLLNSAGLKAGALSTIALQTATATRANESGLTTLDAIEVQRFLAELLAAGCRYAVVEATSHALVQERVSACDFDVAVFTNVGRDHLDYHASWDEYLEAKARLITLCANAPAKGISKAVLLNADDASFPRLVTRPIERRLIYSLERDADLRALDLRPSERGSRFTLELEGRRFAAELPMQGRFNVANALAAAGACLALGADAEQIASGLATFAGIPGRLERVDAGQPFEVYIDFAHAAGALASALGELRRRTRGRLIAVFGSTGRSDHDRPGMGRAAAEGADFFLITSDDPVNEDPAAIASQVEAGVIGRRRGSDYDIELDRREAIRRAVAMARPGDVVLLAGKGHERFMYLATGKVPWNEREVALAAIRDVSR